MLWSCPFLAACRDVSVLNYQFFLHFVFVICEQKGRLNAPPFYIHHAQSSMGSDNNVSRTLLYDLKIMFQEHRCISSGVIFLHLTLVGYTHLQMFPGK